MPPHLILIRGLPGSGKSTIAKTLFNYKHLEADMYHIQNGVYQYDPKNIQAAHIWCQEQTRLALKAGENVVVSNTFVRRWEVIPYLDMRFPISIIIAKGQFQNIHGVPAEVIERMRLAWEHF